MTELVHAGVSDSGLSIPLSSLEARWISDPSSKSHCQKQPFPINPLILLCQSRALQTPVQNWEICTFQLLLLPHGLDNLIIHCHDAGNGTAKVTFVWWSFICHSELAGMVKNNGWAAWR